MEWRNLTKTCEIAAYLEIAPAVFRDARRQRSYIYVERKGGPKGKKQRDLCYPQFDSALRLAQQAIRTKCLEELAISNTIRGYRAGQSQIDCVAEISGLPYQAKIDLKAFHPSIRPGLVFKALRDQGLSNSWCRLITQLTTYNNQVPQGGLTSNHIANLIIHLVLQQGTLEYASHRAVAVINYGDDTAFAGRVQRDVDDCAAHATRAFKRFELVANQKSSAAEHVGSGRKFLGLSTARSQPDVPRAKFEEYRDRFRQILQRERSSRFRLVTDEELESLKAIIGYVRRLNRKKARRLVELLHRIWATVRAKPRTRMNSKGG